MVDQRSSSADILERLFSTLNKHQIKYVVARRYDKLPKETLGGDIDIYVQPDNFDECIYICEQVGFKSDTRERSAINNALSTFLEAIGKPRRAIELVIESPQEIIERIRGSQTQLYRNRQLQNDDLTLDIGDHLTYTSPYDGSQIRVDQSIEQSLFDHRRLYHDVYVPSPPDELAHIIPHCIFDKNGHFSEYYVDRCDQLVEIVTTDERYNAQFKELLSALFYGANDLVYESVITGEYHSLRSRLRQFDDY